jgi:predicted branched-subunit amino acid permease
MNALFGSRRELARVRREAFIRGMRAVAPVALATGTWGVVAGVAMVKVGLTTAQAIGMTLLVFSGTAQLASLPLIAAEAPIWVILLTATVVNLRFVIFSAGLQPFFRRLSLWRRLLLGYIIVDTSFAIFLSRFSDASENERGTTEQVWFFLGMGASQWIVWQSMSIVGILLGAQVPAEWGLEFAAILALIALTLPMIVGKPALVGAVTAGVVAVAAAGAPLKLGLLLAVIAGIAAAMIAEVMLERTTKTGASQ